MDSSQVRDVRQASRYSYLLGQTSVDRRAEVDARALAELVDLYCEFTDPQTAAIPRLTTALIVDLMAIHSGNALLELPEDQKEEVYKLVQRFIRDIFAPGESFT